MFLLSSDEPDDRNLADLEVLVWDPSRMPDDEQIDRFLVMTRSAVLLSYLYCVTRQVSFSAVAFSALTLLVGQQKGHPASINLHHLSPLVLFYNIWWKNVMGQQGNPRFSPVL